MFPQEEEKRVLRRFYVEATILRLLSACLLKEAPGLLLGYPVADARYLRVEQSAAGGEGIGYLALGSYFGHGRPFLGSVERRSRP
jgi:hypothetical protein